MATITHRPHWVIGKMKKIEVCVSQLPVNIIDFPVPGEICSLCATTWEIAADHFLDACSSRSRILGEEMVYLYSILFFSFSDTSTNHMRRVEASSL